MRIEMKRLGCMCLALMILTVVLTGCSTDILDKLIGLDPTEPNLGGYETSPVVTGDVPEDTSVDPAPETEPEVTVPGTEAVTEPMTEPVTEPVTDPGIGGTEPPVTSAPTEPPVTEPTQPTEPVTPPTEPVTPPTQPTQPTEPHTHKYEDTVVEPTCTERGYTVHKCSCGHSYKDTYTAALGHKYKDTVVEPTCTQKGYTEHKCERCGKTGKDTYTDPLGHNWGEWKTVKDSTVTEEGVKERGCTRCSEKETTSIPKKEAEYIDTAALEAYGRRYAYNTYGYDGNPYCNPSTGAGYFPAATKKIYTMEEGYAYARRAVDYQYQMDIAYGHPIYIERDGKVLRCQINLYFEPTGNPHEYRIWCYYGGSADPYCP